jgi:predicted DNA-binding protein
MKTKTKDYHVKKLLNFRLDSVEDRERLDQYAKRKGVSVSWIIKRGLELFWEAEKKGKIKP